MTTFPFNPTTQATWSFQPTLDGQVYSAIITFSLYGQRYYLNLYDLSGNLIVAEAVSGSPDAVSIQSLSWSDGFVTVTTAEPHGYKVGRIATLTISGCSPSAYNGTFQCLATGPSTLRFALASDPGQATALGQIAQNLNLVGGYFTTSSLVYRTQARQFEVAP